MTAGGAADEDWMEAGRRAPTRSWGRAPFAVGATVLLASFGCGEGGDEPGLATALGGGSGGAGGVVAIGRGGGAGGLPGGGAGGTGGDAGPGGLGTGGGTAGGAGTGEPESGGAATGSAASGGVAVGGASSGGAFTGGLGARGGAVTGGAGSGGGATGGVGTGGLVATGGAGQGGFEAGGVGTGGEPPTGGISGGTAGSDGAPGGGSGQGAGGTNIGGASSGGADTGGAATGGTSSFFRNPLNQSHGSDPFMVRYEGYYYLVATTWGTTLTMKRGRTIQELKDATATTIWQDASAQRCCNMWAPELYLVDGPHGLRWYHYYTAGDGDDLGTQRLHVLESEGTDPMGPYHYQGQLMDYWAIDGSVLVVGSSRYLLFSAWSGPTQNVWIIAMTNPWTVTGERTLLTAPTYAWEQEGSDPVNEGPVALYHGGRTFVVYSASQCADPGYKLGLLELTGTNPLAAGAWVKSASPVFQAANGAYGPGHNGFFVSPDGSEDWIVYHATTNPSGSCWTDRTTRVQRFTWNADGTPYFGEPLALDTDIAAPAGE